MNAHFRVNAVFMLYFLRVINQLFATRLDTFIINTSYCYKNSVLYHHQHSSQNNTPMFANHSPAAAAEPLVVVVVAVPRGCGDTVGVLLANLHKVLQHSRLQICDQLQSCIHRATISAQ